MLSADSSSFHCRAPTRDIKWGSTSRHTIDTYGRVPSLPTILDDPIAYFRRILSIPPTRIPGVFINQSPMLHSAGTWNRELKEDASACKLECVDFYKSPNNDIFEDFLVFYFTHPTHPSARAAVAVFSALKDPFEFFCSSNGPPPLFDRLQVVSQRFRLDAYLSANPDDYEKLCVLRYTAPGPKDATPAPEPPSATQISLLLKVARSNIKYDTERNRYLFTDMVFEAVKKIFPGNEEQCHNHDKRMMCNSKLPTFADNLQEICDVWRVRDELEQALKRKTKELRRAHEEHTRAHEGYIRAREAAERAREVEERAREVAQRNCEELEAMIRASESSSTSRTGI